MKINIKRIIIYLASFLGTILTEYIFFITLVSGHVYFLNAEVTSESILSSISNNFFFAILFIFWVIVLIPLIVSYIITYKLVSNIKLNIKLNNVLRLLIISVIAICLSIIVFSVTKLQPQKQQIGLLPISSNELVSTTLTSSSEPVFPITPISEYTPKIAWLEKPLLIPSNNWFTDVNGKNMEPELSYFLTGTVLDGEFKNKRVLIVKDNRQTVDTYYPRIDYFIEVSATQAASLSNGFGDFLFGAKNIIANVVPIADLSFNDQTFEINNQKIRLSVQGSNDIFIPDGWELLSASSNFNLYKPKTNIIDSFSFKDLDSQFLKSVYLNGTSFDMLPKRNFFTYRSVDDKTPFDKITWEEGVVPDFSVFNNAFQNEGKSPTEQIDYYERFPIGCSMVSAVDILSNPDSVLSLKNDFIQVGHTESGNVLYLLKSTSPIWQEFYKQSLKSFPLDIRKSYFDTHLESFENYFAARPFLLYKDILGQLHPLYRRSYFSMGGCGKPVIYLYPEKQEKITLSFSPSVSLTKTEPEYNKRWLVIADTKSRILNLDDNKFYPYLFWEGYGVTSYKVPKEGWIVKKDNLDSFFDNVLLKLGLNQKESSDFKEFWVTKMQKTNETHFFITFIPLKEIEKLVPLFVNPKPDTVIRILMYYEPTKDTDRYVVPLNIITPQRNGFTLVEWGGIIASP